MQKIYIVKEAGFCSIQPIDRTLIKCYHSGARFLRKWLALFKSGQWHFHQEQYTSPQLLPCHRIFDQRWASKQFLTLPIVQTLLPVTFGYSLSSEAVRYETIEEMKEAFTKVIDTAHTRGFLWSLPEVVGTVQQMHCSRRRLLRRD